MMEQRHSVWLMPVSEDLTLLDTIVRRLADALGTPTFCPHLTLMEDMAKSSTDIEDVVKQNFDKLGAFSLPISGVAGLPLFYRSLFAAFEPVPHLLELKTLAVNALRTGDVESFLPHISLAYGVSEDKKSQVIAELARELTGRVVHFDTIAVVASSQETPIEDWKIVRRHLLR